MSEETIPENQKLFEFLQQQLQNVSTEALRNVACIVSFASSKFGDEVKDDFLAAELAKAHNTDSNNLSVRKSIFGDKQFPELSAMQHHVRSTYNKHIALTLPWRSRGSRLLPNARIPEYFGMMGEASQRLASLAEACRAALPRAHARAKAALGTAYNEDDYIGLNNIPDRFQLHFEVEPIPDSSDLNMPEGFEQVQMRGLYEGVRARMARAMQKLWDDTVKALRDAKKKASNPDTKRWHESIKTNVLEPIRAIRGLDLVDDESFLNVLTDVETTISSFDVKHIASLDTYRQKFAKACDQMLASMEKAAEVVGLDETARTANVDVAEDEPEQEEQEDETVGVEEEVVEAVVSAAPVPEDVEEEEEEEEPEPEPEPAAPAKVVASKPSTNATMDELMRRLLGGK